MMASAMFAGIAAGLFAALLHFAFVQKYLLLGEQYESGVSVHFAGVAGAANGAATSAMNEPDSTEARPEGNAQDAAVVPTGTFERNAWTALFFVVLYLSYGLLLVAGMALARRFGQRVTPSDGILWGIAGFASLQLAPALGLAPNLPGIAAAELADRQLWWAATAMATATGLALIAYGRRPLWIGLAVVLLALPHL
ncbi:MAG: CbtA family protein, partial [Pseudomonadota bacterium]